MDAIKMKQFCKNNATPGQCGATNTLYKYNKFNCANIYLWIYLYLENLQTKSNKTQSRMQNPLQNPKTTKLGHLWHQDNRLHKYHHESARKKDMFLIDKQNVMPFTCAFETELTIINDNVPTTPHI